MRFGWELNHQPYDHGRRKNDAPNHSATLPTYRGITKNASLTNQVHKQIKEICFAPTNSNFVEITKAQLPPTQDWTE